jgi:hypothetical protein
MIDIRKEIEDLKELAAEEWRFIRKSRELREYMQDPANPARWRREAAHKLLVLQIRHGDIVPGDPGWFDVSKEP